jgi:hypothetical protein
LFFDRDTLSLIAHYYPGEKSITQSWEAFLGSLTLEWLIRASILGFFVWRLGPQARFIRLKPAFAFALCGWILLILPNAPLSLSRTYQLAALRDLRELTHFTYYLCFALGILFTCAFLVGTSLSERIGGMNGIRMFSILGGLTAAFFSLSNDCTNSYVLHSQRMSTLKWEAIESFSESERFQRIPEGSRVYAPSLWKQPFSVYYTLKNFSGGHHVPPKAGEPNYWEKYFFVISGKRIQILDLLDWESIGKENNNEIPYSLSFHQDPKAPAQALVFAEVSLRDEETKKLLSDRMWVCPHEVNQGFRVEYHTRSSETPIHEVEIPSPASRKEPFAATMIEDKGIDLESVRISFRP